MKYSHSQWTIPSQVRLVGRDRALKVPKACRHGVTETGRSACWEGEVHGEHSEDPESEDDFPIFIPYHPHSYGK